MAKRKQRCDKCGKQRVFKTGRRTGAICGAGHFICKKCQRSSLLWRIIDPISIGIGPSLRKRCPVCNEKLKAVRKRDLV